MDFIFIILALLVGSAIIFACCVIATAIMEYVSRHKKMATAALLVASIGFLFAEGYPLLRGIGAFVCVAFSLWLLRAAEKKFFAY